MHIDKNTVATLAYSMHIDNPEGELLEMIEEQQPKEMIFGFDSLIPGFEKQMMQREVGSSFSFVVTPEEAFGSYRDEMLVDVPKQAFMINGELRSDLLFVGNEIAMMDHQGNPIKGKVLELTDEQVKMDFNHYLAGKQLFVEGKVLDVREVTPDDLQPKNSCGTGCGCGSGQKEESSGCCSDGGHHGHHHHHGEDDCQVCGNPSDQQGEGIGSCQCG